MPTSRPLVKQFTVKYCKCLQKASPNTLIQKCLWFVCTLVWTSFLDFLLFVIISTSALKPQAYLYNGSVTHYSWSIQQGFQIFIFILTFFFSSICSSSGYPAIPHTALRPCTLCHSTKWPMNSYPQKLLHAPLAIKSNIHGWCL